MESSRSLPFFIIVIIGAIGVFVLGGYLVSQHQVPTFSEYMASSTPFISVSPEPTDLASGLATSTLLLTPRGVISIELATTSDEQERGLSGRTSLAADQGMLFVFPEPGRYAFWMKDMAFPIDMVWIGADKRVAGVTRAISPKTYPLTFLPPYDITYVLEVSAGVAEKLGMATGTKLTF